MFIHVYVYTILLQIFDVSANIHHDIAVEIYIHPIL